MSVDAVSSSTAADAIGQTAATPPPAPPADAAAPSGVADRDNPVLVDTHV